MSNRLRGLDRQHYVGVNGYPTEMAGLDLSSLIVDLFDLASIYIAL